MFYSYLVITAIVLAALASMEQFVPVGLDSMERFILPVAEVG